MRWSKIKNIIIFLLVVVDLFLLALVGVRVWRTAQNERMARQRMITVLDNNGISFQPAQIPDRLELPPARLTLTLPGRPEAEALLGQVTTVDLQGASTRYAGPAGQVWVDQAGELTVRYTVPALDEAAALDLLAALGVQLRALDRVEALDPVTGQTLLTLRCCRVLAGVPLPWEPVTLSLRGGLLEGLSLAWLSGEQTDQPQQETLSASTALLRLLSFMQKEGYVFSSITDMLPGYTLSGTTPQVLTPVWYVETDVWRFTVDGLTGEVLAGE